MTQEDLDRYHRMIENKKIKYMDSPESLAKLEDYDWQAIIKYYSNERRD